MSDNNVLLAKLEEMEKLIVSRLEKSIETKISTLTEQALQEAHENIYSNRISIVELKDDVDIMKGNVNNNTDDIHRIDKIVKDNLLRITAQEKVAANNEQRLQFIE